mgnify:FL=1
MVYVTEKDYLRAVDWSKVEDEMDLKVWRRANTNQWLPEKIALSKDRRPWTTLTESEQNITMRVFGGLTLLDSTQTQVGCRALLNYCLTPHEDSVLTQFDYMEAVHTQTYSSIFMTLTGTSLIASTFRWVESDRCLQKKARLIVDAYQSEDPLKVRVASVFLESFLFYSGFYWPLYLLSRNLLTATATAIKLIIRDEAVHGFYIGYKFRQVFAKESPARKKEIMDYAYDLMMELYANEVEYTEQMYGSVGLEDDVGAFLRLNANKAFSNLGFAELFPAEECQVNPAILRAMRSDSKAVHDFFSIEGSAYFIPTFEDTENSDWECSDADDRLSVYA